MKRSCKRAILSVCTKSRFRKEKNDYGDISVECERNGQDLEVTTYHRLGYWQQNHTHCRSITSHNTWFQCEARLESYVIS
jgi:hypothetical protein